MQRQSRRMLAEKDLAKGKEIAKRFVWKCPERKLSFKTAAAQCGWAVDNTNGIEKAS